MLVWHHGSQLMWQSSVTHIHSVNIAYNISMRKQKVKPSYKLSQNNAGDTSSPSASAKPIYKTMPLAKPSYTNVHSKSNWPNERISCPWIR